MGIQEDDREHMYKDRLYHLIGSDGWVDIRDLTVHIKKSKSGVTVSIYPAEHDGRGPALTSCHAEFPPEEGKTGRRVTINRVMKNAL